MNKIDSIKLKIEDIINFNPELFQKQSKTDESGTVVFFKLKNKSFGLNEIIIFNNGTAIIEISSKILQEKYIEGITAENINMVLEHLSQYIKFSIENITVLKLDIFKHIETANKADFINQLKVLNRTAKYKLVEFYKNESAVFEKDNKTKSLKDRIIFYDKQAELENSYTKEDDKEKKEIIFSIIENKEFKNIIRVELNIKALSKARELLKISDNKLTSILSSKENVIDNLIDNYFKTQSVKLADDEERQILYYCYVIEKSLLNTDEIEKEIRKKYKTKYLIDKELKNLELAKEKIKKEYSIENFNILNQLK